jgi:hypothetical protein
MGRISPSLLETFGKPNKDLKPPVYDVIEEGWPVKSWHGILWCLTYILLGFCLGMIF